MAHDRHGDNMKKYLPEILYTISWLSFFGMIKLLLSLNLTEPEHYVLTRFGMFLLTDSVNLLNC